MRKARRVTFLIPFLAIVAMLAGSVAYLMQQGRLVLARLPEIVRSAAAERIRGRVAIGDISLHPFGIELRDVSIRHAGSGSAEPVAEAPVVRIICDIPAVILRKVDPASSIKRIDIIHPKVTVHRAFDGGWDLVSLLKPSSKPPSGKTCPSIYVQSGQITVYDRKGRKKTERNVLSRVDAIIDMADPQHLAFRASGQGPAGRMRRFAVQGSYSRPDHSFDVRVDAQGASAPYWSDYPYHSGVKVISGTGDARVRVSRGVGAKRVRYSATIDLRRSAISLHPIQQPIRDVTGRVEVCRDAVTLNLRCRLGTSPTAVRGCVVDFRHPHLALSARSDRLNLREAVNLTPYAKSFRAVDLPTSGRGDARIYGPVRRFNVAFTATAPSLSFGILRGRSVSVTGVYTGKRIDLNRVSAKCFGGDLSASGGIEFGRRTEFNLDGRVSALALESVPALRRIRLSGRVNSDIGVKWRPGDLVVVCNGQSTCVKAGGYSADNVEVSGRYSNGSYLISDASARLLGGTARASGDILADGRLRLDIAGEGINLARLGTAFRRSSTVGWGQFAGALTGTVSSPVFDGRLEAYRTVVSGVEIDRAVADVVASRRQIDLRRMDLYSGTGSITVSGRVLNPLAVSPNMDMHLVARQIGVDMITEAAGRSVPLEGTLSSDLSIRGIPSSPFISGRLHLRDASYMGVPIELADLHAEYRGRTLCVQDLRILCDGASLTAQGVASRDHGLSMSFDARRLPLDRLSSLSGSYACVSGDASAQGIISGDIQNPHVETSLKVTDPIINGQHFSSITGGLSWQDRKLSVAQLRLEDGGSCYELSDATYTPSAQRITGSLAVRSGDAGRLLALVDECPLLRRAPSSFDRLRSFIAGVPRPFSGTVDGSLKGSVSWSDGTPRPDLGMDISIHDMGYGTSRVSSLTMAASWRNDIAKLERFEMLDGDTSVAADAAVGPSDALSLHLDAQNLSLGSLRQWVKLPDNISGKADVTIVAGGTTAEPDSEMYIEIVDPVLSGVKFDRFRARLSSKPGTETYDDSGNTVVPSRLDIDEVTLVLGKHDFRASGYIPVDWRRMTVPLDAPILLESNLDSDNLRLLSAVTGISIDTREGGRFDGQIRLAGSVRSPKLDGELVWRNGVMRVPKLNEAFEDISADCILSGNRLSVDKLVAKSGDGGSLEIQGDVTFANLKPDLDLGIVARGLKVSSRNLSNTYDEDAALTISGGLKVAGELASPLISGELRIPEASVVIPSKPAKPVDRSALRIDPRFRTTVTLGRDVRVRSPRLRTPVAGDLSIGGSLSKPVVDGTFDISSGTILFPMRSFKMLSGSSMQVHYTVNQPPVVLLDMQAQSRVTAASPLGADRRYTVLMTAQGPLDHLSTSFSSSPPGLSEDMILGLVTGQNQLQRILAGDGSGEFAKELSGLFSTAMMPTVFDPIERAFQNVLGFEEFALEMGYREPIQLTVGYRLLDSFYLSYSAALGARTDYLDNTRELRLAYRFKRGLELGVSTDPKTGLNMFAAGKLRF